MTYKKRHTKRLTKYNTFMNIYTCIKYINDQSIL